MSTSTTYLSLIKPEVTDTTKIREDFNTNMDTIDGRFSTTYMAVQDKSSVTITGGSIVGITDLAIADGGTSASTSTAAFDALAPTTTTGDIIYSNGTNNVRLVKGTSGQFLKIGASIPEWASGAGGYTNLTSFVDQTAWRVFYSNTAGDVTELALGTNGEYLKSNGATSAPTWATPSGAGDVSKVGTPSDNQVGVWIGDGTLEGHSSLTYDRSTLQLTGNITMTGELDITGVNAIIDLNPAQTGTVQVINITPTAILTTNEAEWRGIHINGNALQPSGSDISVYGMCLDFGTFTPTGDAAATNHVDGLKVIMPDLTEHALHIIDGKIRITAEIPSTAIARFSSIDISYDIDAMVSTSGMHAIDVAVDEGTPAGDIVAIGTHTHVAVIHQIIGTFESPDQEGADSFAGIDDAGDYIDGIDGIAMFNTNGDGFWIGDGAMFDELEVDMSTDATKDVEPTFWYWKTDDWEQFYPADDTEGFQHSGLIRWISGDLTGWSSGDPASGEGETGYWIKVTRTGVANPGTPTAEHIKTGAITLYSWDKVGDLTVKDIDANDIDAASLVLDNPLIPAEGGTGVANGVNNTITFTGNFTLGLTLTANTAIQLPTSGTLVNTAVATLSSLTSIGTIGTGVWEGTDVGLAHGGTGVGTGAMVNFTSVLNVALYIGRDADNQIKFATDNNIIFRTSGADGALFYSTGELDMNTHTIGFTLQTLTGDGSDDIDWKLGNKMKLTLPSGDETLTFIAPTNPCNLVLHIVQDNTGGRDVTFPVSVKWLGTEPTWSDGGANKSIVMSMWYDGTNYWSQGTSWEA